jgi:hypothetical protein
VLPTRALFFESPEAWWRHLEAVVEALALNGEHSAEPLADDAIWQAVAFSAAPKISLSAVRDAAMEAARDAIAQYRALESLETIAARALANQSPPKSSKKIKSSGAGAGRPRRERRAAVPARVTQARRYHAALTERLASPCSMSRWTSRNLTLWTHAVEVASRGGAGGGAGRGASPSSAGGEGDGADATSFAARIVAPARSTFAAAKAEWRMSIVGDTTRAASASATCAVEEDPSVSDALALCASVSARDLLFALLTLLFAHLL